jgi:predicted GH43/DUF377 family glycosyl hydrolase
MYHWEKLGRVFNPGEHPGRPTWMHEYAQAPCTLVYDDFVRVYFSCRPPRDADGQCVSYSTYIDLDRNDLFHIIRLSPTPVLELGERGCFDEFGIYPLSVIRVDNKVMAYYTGHTRCESVPFDTAIGLALSSDDGKTFHRAGRGPVLASSYKEPFGMSGPKIRRYDNVYYLFYICGQRWISDNGRSEMVFKIRMATSKDGLEWRKENKSIIEERLGTNEVQSSPDVIFCNGRYHMFFSYMVTPDFRYDTQKGYRIGYAVSDDLLHWSRDDAKAGIAVSSSGFDCESIAYPHVFELDGRIYMLYLGNEVGRHGFGIARLRGFL